jgi:nucleotide-binding universal stress UspA family protein
MVGNWIVIYDYIALQHAGLSSIFAQITQKVSAMYKLLIPVDGSANSERAVRHVVELAKVVGAVQANLLNVQPAVIAWEVKRFLREQEIEAMQTSLAEEATQAARAILDEAGISYHLHHAVGEVAETIAEFAEACGCNQIVMGSRGMGSLEGLLLGSISTKVLHLVSVPVTLVK